MSAATTEKSTADLDPRPKLFLIDGSGFIFRAFHALPNLTRADGTPVGAVLGFCNMLLRILTETEAAAMAVIFDHSRQTFRNDLYPAYKAHRPEPPLELVPQFSLIRQATGAFGLPSLEVPGYEADDVIATYARLGVAAGYTVSIVSSDKDLLQLLRPQVFLYDPLKNVPMGAEAAVQKFGVPPEKVIDVQALAGDSTDNVPGVPGIGIKSAAELITTYGNLETLLARADEIKQPKRREALQTHAEMARLSKKLVTLLDSVPVTVPVSDLAVKAPEAGLLLQFLQMNGFKSVTARAESWLKKQGAALPSVSSSLSMAPAATATPALSVVGTPATDPASQEAGDDQGIAAIRAADRDYKSLHTVADLQAFLEGARERGGLAIDTETDGLVPSVAKLVGFSLATAPGVAAYVPLQHVANGDGGNAESGLFAPRLAEGQIPLADAVRTLKPFLADPAILKVGHNLKFDWQVLAQHGLTIESYDDTMLLSYVLSAGLHGHGMDELSLRHLGHVKISYDDLTGKGKARIPFPAVSIEAATRYAAEDADDTLRLWLILRPKLAAAGLTSVYERCERPIVPVVAAMEAAGVLLDREKLAGLSQDFAGRLAVLEGEIHQLAGQVFNVGSPKQLGEVLFDALGLPGGVKGKTGAYSTASDVLEPLAEAGHAIAEKVLEWRGFAKLKSTYTDTLPEQIQARTGRVHTSYNLVGAVTGRFSSTDPNLQNIPIRTEEGRAIREAFIAAPDWRLISADYSQIELRLVAEMADVAALKAAFAEGQDIHVATAAKVFGLTLAAVMPAQRRQAKAINFGIIYGISAFGLAKQIGASVSEAQAFIQAYFKEYPEILAYMEKTKALARAQGYVTTHFGRRVHIDGIQDKSPARRAYAERQAINAPIQGSAADIIKRAMAALPAALRDAQLSARLLMQVHDELVLEAPEAEAEKAAALTQDTMRNAAKLSIPLLVEAEISERWG